MNIDKIVNEEDKICKIGTWLYKLFKDQRGLPQPITFKLTVFQCYHLFNSEKQFNLWCGHFQDMFALFSTAAGLLNRYVEIVPINKQAISGFHEVNEVYLSSKKKWVMVDVTTNRILLKNGKDILTAAEYYDIATKKEKVQLLLICQADWTKSNDNSLQNNVNDIYFDKNHFLRYYYTKDLTKVYSVKSKILRYFLSNPWYENYDPLRKHSNILFRVKQIIGFVTLILAFIFLHQFLTKKT